MAVRSGWRGADGEGASPFRFKGPLSGPAVLLTLRSIMVLYMCAPAFAAAAFAFEPHVRSWAAVAIAVVLIVAIVALNVVDGVRLRKARLETFTAAKAFAEASVAIVAYGAAVAALGPRDGAMLLLPILPFLVVGLFGDLKAIAADWVLLLATYAIALHGQVSAGHDVWLTLLFGTFGLSACLMMHTNASAAVNRARAEEALATVAAESGMLQRWPEDLEIIAARLAEAMDVHNYAVFAGGRAANSLEMVFAWPTMAGLPAPEPVLSGVVFRAAAERRFVSDLGVLAVSATAGDTVTVVVVPPRSKRRVPPDPAPVRVVASLLASMLDRSIMVVALLDQATTDPLTGLANRRAMSEMLSRELTVHRRSTRPLSVAMLDIDHFKSHNDRYGHAAGDALLRTFGETLRARMRAQDLAMRFGGEEFVVVLPDTDVSGATCLLEELREVGAGRDPRGARVSFSGGVAVWDGFESAEDLVRRADAALYKAKQAGRDRVVVAANGSDHGG